MSSARRHLVQRSRPNAESSQASRGRDSEAHARQQHALPPYEPPTCGLTANAKRQIDDLRTNRNTAKYVAHIKGSIDTITMAAGACNDTLNARQEGVEKNANKRKRDGVEDANKPPEHIEAENYLKSLTKQVESLTEKSEKALRDLIDLGDEAKMQDIILKEVEENITIAPTPQPARRQRNSEEDENGAPAADPEIMSAVELIKKAKSDYAATYQSKPLRERYGDSNYYKNFKRTVHDAQNPGEDAPPVPHANTWFPEENVSASSRRRQNSNTDNNNNGDEGSDDDIVIESATTNLKCGLTLKYFTEPFSNNICPHTFEKAAITEYYDKNATAYTEQGGQRGERRFLCPQVGCEKMLKLTDFYDDTLMARKVKRALKAAARQNDDDDEDDAPPKGSQRRRPEQIGSDDERMDIDKDDVRQKRIAKFKKESTRDLSRAPRRSGSSEPGEGEIEMMDMV